MKNLKKIISIIIYSLLIIAVSLSTIFYIDSKNKQLRKYIYDTDTFQFISDYKNVNRIISTYSHNEKNFISNAPQSIILDNNGKVLDMDFICETSDKSQIIITKNEAYFKLSVGMVSEDFSTDISIDYVLENVYNIYSIMKTSLDLFICYLEDTYVGCQEGYESYYLNQGKLDKVIEEKKNVNALRFRLRLEDDKKMFIYTVV